MASKVLDMGAAAMQSLRPVKQVKQHVCTFALYAHDPKRQVETHHYVSRLNQDFLQCAVYDSDKPSARLIGTRRRRLFSAAPARRAVTKITVVMMAGVEYIVSDTIFEGLPPDEQRLWHSHAYEVKAGLWTDVAVPEALQSSEMASLAKTYGKFWCTWQVDRSDRLLLGAPALMVSPAGRPRRHRAPGPGPEAGRQVRLLHGGAPRC